MSQGDGRGVIFDLDGTLADTLDDITAAVNVLLARIGRPPVPREVIRPLIGQKVPGVLERASGIADLKSMSGLVELYRPVYMERLLDTTRLYAGVTGMLDRLAESGVVMCVLSNKSHEFTVPICEALLDRWPFVRCVGATDERPRKPDPDLPVELAGEMGCPVSKVCIVGDSPTDILAAANAGMRSIGVTWGYGDREDLIAAGPDRIIDKPMQLIDLMQRD